MDTSRTQGASMGVRYRSADDATSVHCNSHEACLDALDEMGVTPDETWQWELTEIPHEVNHWVAFSMPQLWPGWRLRLYEWG